MSNMRNKFSPEFRDRADRRVEEHRGDYPSEWAAMTSIAGKVGCTIETLRKASAHFAQAELDRYGKWGWRSLTLTGENWVSGQSAASWRSPGLPTTNTLPA